MVKIIAIYSSIIIWLFVWSVLELFEWLSDLYGMIFSPVGSINFWILLIVPMIPVAIAAGYLGYLHTAKSTGDNTTKAFFIASAIVFVSGSVLIISAVLF